MIAPPASAFLARAAAASPIATASSATATTGPGRRRAIAARVSS
jgi:hypothetical protein